MSESRRVYGVAFALLVLACSICYLIGWGGPPLWAVPALVGGVAITEYAMLRTVIGRQGVSVGLTDALAAIPFLLAPGNWVVIALTFTTLLVNFRRLSPIKLVFNACQLACALAIGIGLVELLDGGIVASAVGLLAFGVSNLAFIAIAVSITAHKSYAEVVLESSRIGSIQIVGNVSIGLLAAWLTANAPLGLLGLVAPLVLLWWSYQQQAQRAAEARLFAQLSRGQEEASANSLETSAQVIITAAARLFGGAEVEMLLRHPDGPVHYAGDENGVNRRDRADADAFAAPWVLRTMGARGVRIGTEDDQPYCSAVLGDPERPLAVLIARRPIKAAPFERLDSRLAQVLVGQAEAWLSAADLATRHGAAVDKINAYGETADALGDLGASTAPSLVVLRESAERLSRLAYSFNGPDPMREIVDELHSTERAVASLLGAIALTTDPELVTGVEATAAADRGQVDSEWTTTGRMDMSDLR